MFILKQIASSFVLLIFLTISVQAQDATEIVQKANEKMQGESSRAEMTMQIIRPRAKRLYEELDNGRRLQPDSNYGSCPRRRNGLPDARK